MLAPSQQQQEQESTNTKSHPMLRSIPSGLFSSSMLDDSEYFSSTVDSTLHAKLQPQLTRESSIDDTASTATMRTSSFQDEDWDDNEQDEDSAFGSSFSASILVLEDYRLPLIQEEETIPTTPKMDRYHKSPIKTAAPSSPPSIQRFQPSLENEEIMDIFVDTSSLDLSLGDTTTNRLVLSDLLVHMDAASATE
jgi:hypothetical protein